MGNHACSLHNVKEHSPTAPLVIWIPPFSHLDTGFDTAPPPPWLRQYATAVINYRWSLNRHDDPEPEGLEEEPSVPPLKWPTPLHDISFGYSWIVKNLSPPDLRRRDIYVCGSHLGASLAAGLALTESHTHEPMAVRGLITFNGIYDWTTFLPDHPVHRPVNGSVPGPPEQVEAGWSPVFKRLKAHLPVLFTKPEDLFDPFVSAVLFFHTAGLWVPPGFNKSCLIPSAWKGAAKTLPSADGISTPDDFSPNPPEGDVEEDDHFLYSDPPRKGYMVFPPRQSTLRLPQTLLLHSDDPFRNMTFSDDPYEDEVSDGGGILTLTNNMKTKRKPRLRKLGKGLNPLQRAVVTAQLMGDNSYGTQATELASMMQRSVEMVETRERAKWDDDFLEEYDSGDQEAQRRVRVAEVPYNDAEVVRAIEGITFHGDGDLKNAGLLLDDYSSVAGMMNERAQQEAAAWLEDRIG